MPELVQRPRDWVYTVEKCLDRFCALGTGRFRRLLGFHQDFHSQKSLQAPKMDISGDKYKVLSIKELSYDLVVPIQVKDDLSVSVCVLGLTLVAVVVVEIWGEISPHRIEIETLVRKSSEGRGGTAVCQLR